MSPARDLQTHQAPRGGGAAVAELLTSAAVLGTVVLIEPELVAGIAIGAGAILASRWLGELVGGVIRPMVKSAVWVGYSAVEQTREMVSEASEGVQDLVAEARAEHESKPVSQ